MQNLEFGEHYPPLPEDGVDSDLLDPALDPSAADAESSEEVEYEEEDAEQSGSKAPRKRGRSEDLGDEATSRNTSSSEAATEGLNPKVVHDIVPLNTLHPPPLKKLRQESPWDLDALEEDDDEE